jgi:hypothetical protein
MLLPRPSPRLLALAVVGMVALTWPSSVAACGCGMDFCPLHCPEDARRDPVRAVEFLDEVWNKLTPEQKAAAAPLLEAKKTLTVVAGDIASNKKQQVAHIEDRVEVKHPVSSAMEELKLVTALTQFAASVSPESGRGVTDSAWNDLVSRSVAQSSVTVRSFDINGRPIKETARPPEMPNAPPRPNQGFARDPRSLLKARSVVEDAANKPPVIRRVDVPSPSTQASAPGRDLSAATQFFQEQVNHFKKLIQGEPIVVSPSPASP